jgi:hypothetical protein
MVDESVVADVVADVGALVLTAAAVIGLAAADGSANSPESRDDDADGCFGCGAASDEAEVEWRSGDETATGESALGSGRRKGDERGVPMPRGDGLYGDAVAEADWRTDAR